ncbi:MAG TPA: PIN domain-containing protein [Thermoanaerobaculia bacterium]|nr:PIN domain-containing protein [Thermoanaerobaculia bacterium]
MIVIVETNFIIEFVLQQEHSRACEELLALCGSGIARLAIPSFAVAEAGMMLERSRGERRKFLNEDLSRQRGEIGTAKLLQRYEAILIDLEKELVAAQSESDSRWLDFRNRLESADVIPLTAAALEETISIQVGREIEQWPDALVLASVKSYLVGVRATGASTPAVFVSTDGAAFGRSIITRQLRKLGCTYVNSFANAVRYLRSKSHS